MPSKHKAPHHKGTHQVRSKQVRDAAYANPDTRCWRCGRTLTEVRRTKPHAEWHAGHVVDGVGPLAPECSPCNLAGGARITNTKKARQGTTTLRW